MISQSYYDRSFDSCACDYKLAVLGLYHLFFRLLRMLLP